MPLTDRLSANLQTAGTSFPDRLMIWLHVAFVIFAIGPVTIAILASPRYIRTHNVAVLRYLLRTTRIFGIASLGVLAFGIAAAQALHKLSAPWVTTAMTLFVVALVLIALIMRDQRRAVVALETASQTGALAAASNAPAASGPAGSASAANAPTASAPTPSAPAAGKLADGARADGGPAGDDDAPDAQAIPVAPTARPPHPAPVERGRIASMAGIVTLIWLVILVLMIWNS